MKVLIIMTMLSPILGVANTTCNITLLKKKASAKTFYTLKGETISKSVIKKLNSECSFDIKLMSNKMKREIDIKRLQKKLAKLQGGL